MLDFIFKVLFGSNDSSSSEEVYRNGKTSEMRKKDGSIDHRGHSGFDRTPAQKEGDKSRRK